MKIAAAAVAISIASCAAASAQDVNNLRGLYDAIGTNFNGSPYKGTVGILPTSPLTCRIRWKIGDDEIDGICMRDGDVLVAAYSIRNVPGLIAYRIKDDGSLEGSWTIADQKGVGMEKLVPQPKR